MPYMLSIARRFTVVKPLALRDARWYILAIQPVVVYKRRMSKAMVNFRMPDNFVEILDRLAEKHHRTRTAEVIALIEEAGNKEFPDLTEAPPKRRK